MEGLPEDTYESAMGLNVTTWFTGAGELVCVMAAVEVEVAVDPDSWVEVDVVVGASAPAVTTN